jgi:hypothetical protein
VIETRDVLTMVVSRVERRRLRHSLGRDVSWQMKMEAGRYLRKDQGVESPSFQVTGIGGWI